MTTDEPEETSTVKARTAPAADDARKPAGPADLAKPTWTYIAKRTLREFGKDQCPDAAAGLTYYAVLSLFPALLALVSLLGIFGQAGRTTGALLDVVRSIAPGSTVDAIRQPIEELTTSASAGFALVIGLATALWSASGYVGAFSRAMNRVYEVDEGRGFVKLRATMLGVTVLTIAIVALIAGMLAISGPVADTAGTAAGFGGDIISVWSIAKWPVIVLLVIVNIAVLYYATPNVKQPRFRWMSIGSFIALLVFVLASLGFAFYVANFSSYNKTYGTIGGVIVALLWLWILNMSLLFGAEFDAEMERGRELQAGISAEETIQLPPRGTKRSKKLQDQEETEIHRGQELREQNRPEKN
ncbi:MULTISPECIES: YihY/virulence factor BrkB family protein [Arthrobacter]|uniref:YihY/virulence factor BrkB family protein n=1 Tax=Arthrobacter terricola TaxID=2547396 RepID=A0A4R5KDX3_9MICC|nr:MULTISPECIES: YihY/virulence factor BrkB family protein [Arthrobacter]MBT8162625.1 YihY/virulence factor BrkB family protein [Arthrobacter sp. GN70]TDF92407.1 YihY/virulence factor BrkB family protein [Arthrobacter terricola]